MAEEHFVRTCDESATDDQRAMDSGAYSCSVWLLVFRYVCPSHTRYCDDYDEEEEEEEEEQTGK